MDRKKNDFEYEIIEKNDLVMELKETSPEYGDSSIRWSIYKMHKKKSLVRIDANHYTSLPLIPYEQPAMSEVGASLLSYLSQKFKMVDFIVYESLILNEWINHQINRNMIFIETERGFLEEVFFAVKQKCKDPVLLRPSKKEIELYSGDTTIIVQKMMTQAPIRKVDHTMKLEKLVVDLVSRDIISDFINLGELRDILEMITRKYLFNPTTAKAYAKRRKNEAKLVDLLKTTSLFKDWNFD